MKKRSLHLLIFGNGRGKKNHVENITRKVDRGRHGYGADSALQISFREINEKKRMKESWGWITITLS